MYRPAPQRRLMMAAGWLLLLMAPVWAQTPVSDSSVASASKPKTGDLSESAQASDPDQDAQIEILKEGLQQLQQGNTADAIAIADQVIAHYEAKYGDAKTQWFVARSPQEALLYMVRAASSDLKGADKRNATAITTIAWPEAYYLKGYALVEVGEPDKGKQPLERAIQLMPYNSQYLSELGNIYQSQKNWSKAMELYTRAESASEFSDEDVKLRDKTRAKRGIGFVLVEQDKLDEAEKEYKECLALDPNDSHSPQELEYIRLLRLEKK